MTDEKENLTDEQYLDRAEKRLAEGRYDLAQNNINFVTAKSARKYFIQSEIYNRQQWYSEQRKQLKAAVKAEPDNETYKAKLAELEEFRKQGGFKNQKKQMGNSDRAKMCEACCSGSCEGIGEGICNAICTGPG